MPVVRAIAPRSTSGPAAVYLTFMPDVQVMMLAAGLGTRLWPLTADRGKPAVPFLGRPLVRGMLDWVVEHGFRKVVVNTHHRPQSIQAALEAPPPEVELAFSHEDKILGTAGALAHALSLGLLVPDRTTLVVNAKLVSTLDLTAALNTHRKTNAAVTMILRNNRGREAFTTVQLEGSRVLGFGPSRVPEGPQPLLFTGLHFLEPAVLRRAQPRFSDTIKDLYPPEIRAGRVHAHIDDTGAWKEASTLQRYLDLQLEAVAEQVHRQPGATVAETAQANGVIMGPNTHIDEHARVEEAVLWKEARVGVGAQLRRVVLGEGVHVPPQARLENVVAVRPDRLGPPPSNAPPRQNAYGLAVFPLATTSS